MPFPHAAMIEAVSVAVHARVSDPGSAGGYGGRSRRGHDWSAHYSGGAAAGAGRVFVLDVDDSRLELARSLGATQTFNSRSADVIPQILELTSGRGADIAMECVGSTVPVKLALDSVRKGGCSDVDRKCRADR